MEIDPPPASGSLIALLFPPLLNKAQNKGTQGVQVRYAAELPPFMSIVRCPGRPVILGMDFRDLFETLARLWRLFADSRGSQERRPQETFFFRLLGLRARPRDHRESFQVFFSLWSIFILQGYF